MNLYEKYRPTSLDDVIGQKEIVDSLSEKDDLNDMMFLGTPGTGKTTIALILSKKFGLPLEELNASDERGIGVVRGKIKKIAYTKTKKIILLDEADSLTDDAQAALRRIMEKSPSVFILTGNNRNKFIKAIKSRCTIYDFEPLSEKQILQRIIHICKNENIDIEKSDETRDGIKTLVSSSGGDLRKAINILQKVTSKGKITPTSVLSLLKPNHVAQALKTAMGGDLESALRLLENDFKSRSPDVDTIIPDIYDYIKEIPQIDYRARLYYKLHEVADSCRYSDRPIQVLVHLSGYLSYAWLLPHFSKKCPVMGDMD